MAFRTPFRQLHWSYICVLNLWLLLNPWHLCAEYSMGTIPGILSLTDPRNLLTLVTFITIISLGIYSVTGREKHHKVLLISLALMILPFIPASNLFFTIGFVIAERVLYIPSLGFCLMIGYGTWYALRRTTDQKALSILLRLGLVYLLAIHTTKTALRNRDWYSSMTLFTSAVRISPDNAKMYSNLATVYENSGNRSVAEELLRQTIMVEPLYISGYMNLAHVLKKQERMDEAIEVSTTTVGAHSRAFTSIVLAIETLEYCSSH